MAEKNAVLTTIEDARKWFGDRWIDVKDSVTKVYEDNKHLVIKDGKLDFTDMGVAAKQGLQKVEPVVEEIAKDTGDFISNNKGGLLGLLGVLLVGGLMSEMGILPMLLLAAVAFFAGNMLGDGEKSLFGGMFKKKDEPAAGAGPTVAPDGPAAAQEQSQNAGTSVVTAAGATTAEQLLQKVEQLGNDHDAVLRGGPGINGHPNMNKAMEELDASMRALAGGVGKASDVQAALDRAIERTGKFLGDQPQQTELSTDKAGALKHIKELHDSLQELRPLVEKLTPETGQAVAPQGAKLTASGLKEFADSMDVKLFGQIGKFVDLQVTGNFAALSSSGKDPNLILSGKIEGDNLLLFEASGYRRKDGKILETEIVFDTPAVLKGVAKNDIVDMAAVNRELDKFTNAVDGKTLQTAIGNGDKPLPPGRVRETLHDAPEEQNKKNEPSKDPAMTAAVLAANTAAKVLKGLDMQEADSGLKGKPIGGTELASSKIQK